MKMTTYRNRKGGSMDRRPSRRSKRKSMLLPGEKKEELGREKLSTLHQESLAESGER
jgi:hypothetical protein